MTVLKVVIELFPLFNILRRQLLKYINNNVNDKCKPSRHCEENYGVIDEAISGILYYFMRLQQSFAPALLHGSFYVIPAQAGIQRKSINTANF
ncbi:hypothetical protein [Rickettsia felis]|uniref:hypothetical protein n=1 Tax=Rickettsia felis TaxID=42862 RepID=UPI000B2FE944|nr:hypothetical protein [Rickettsia felis]